MDRERERVSGREGKRARERGKGRQRGKEREGTGEEETERETERERPFQNSTAQIIIVCLWLRTASRRRKEIKKITHSKTAAPFHKYSAAQANFLLDLLQQDTGVRWPLP